MNDLPVNAIPPNVQHLACTDDGNTFPAEERVVHASDFQFYVSPFSHLLHKRVAHTAKSSDPTYGFSFADDELLQKAYIEDISANSTACALYSNRQAARNKLRGAFLVSTIDGDRIFTAAAAAAKLQSIYNQGVCREIPIVFAPERKLTTTVCYLSLSRYLHSIWIHCTKSSSM